MERLYDANSVQARCDRLVARVAAAQFGVFTQAQAAEVGVTSDMIQYRVRTGRWERVARDVFRLAGSPTSWRQTLLAACLAWGPGAVVSHLAAAALWRLAGFEMELVHLTVPRSRKRARGPGIVHRHALPRADVTTIEGIPVTTPARTLIDLASVTPAEAVEEALDDALRRGLVSIPHLRRRLAALARPGRPGVALMRRLLDARDPSAATPQSVFERRVLRVFREADLPEPVLQYEIRDGDQLIATVDFAFPETRLAIEADGYRWHSGRRKWDHDRARLNRLTLLGWRVIHVTWTDLTRRPETVTKAIANALATKPRTGP